MDRQKKIRDLQELLLELREKHPNTLLTARYGKAPSNTTRTKKYKVETPSLDLSSCNQILSIDPEERVATVEPRVTMEKLVRATLPYSLMPKVVPEFKGITVGGAIMGEAAESTSHLFGSFHDTCLSYEIMLGNGEILEVSRDENPSLFSAIPGSYGSLGLLLSAKISLMPIEKSVELTFHHFKNPRSALKKIEELRGTIPFLDGIVFSPTHTVIMEGEFTKKFSSTSYSGWFFSHVKTSQRSLTLPVFEYLFRYDLCAFWMGAYLFHLPLLSRFFLEGAWEWVGSKEGSFTPKQIERFHQVPIPHMLLQKLTAPWMESKKLWGLLHKAEEWVQDRFVIQDFCMPRENSGVFLVHIIDEVGLYPLWLCPMREGGEEQLFSPHRGEQPIVNIGTYGLPSKSLPMEEILRPLEKRTHELGGRKVLYSRSCYTEDEFWQIYDREAYEALRKKSSTEGVFPSIIDKVLSF